jgi:hypothetical protein
LGQLAAQATGTYHETFHFVLNNTVAKDNRIPPYGFDYEEARKRNALPVPADQYRNADGNYRYYGSCCSTRRRARPTPISSCSTSPPVGSTYSSFYLANNGQNAFLANEGVNLLNAWLNTGMAEPHVMAMATWGSAPPPPCGTPGTPQSLAGKPAKKAVTLTWSAGDPTPAGGYRIYYSQSGKLQFRAGVGPTVLTYKDGGLTSRVSYTYVVTAWNDCNGNGVFDAGVDTESAPSAPVSATAG